MTQERARANDDAHARTQMLEDLDGKLRQIANLAALAHDIGSGHAHAGTILAAISDAADGACDLSDAVLRLTYSTEREAA